MPEFKKKLNLLFAHNAWTSQFYSIANYLNDNKLANVYQITSEDARQDSQFNPKIRQADFTFSKDTRGNPKEDYPYASVKRFRTAKGLYNSVIKIVKSWEIDLIFCHYSSTSPLYLFDEVDIPIGVYVEFPSFRHHGYNPKYPPQKAQELKDKILEMHSYYSALKSSLVITPSKYSALMFPKELQHKVHPILDGFDIAEIRSCKSSYKLNVKTSPNETVIGFTAKTLCTAKGFDKFMEISTEISKQRNDIRFVVIGSPEGGYGYEMQHIQDRFKTFKDYLINKYKPDLGRYHFFNALPYEDYASCLEQIDIFLYPLNFGSANWGAFEILIRGGVILSSNSCFLPEVIKNGENGITVDYNDNEAWIRELHRLIDNKILREKLSVSALQMSKIFDVEKAASSYLKVFQDAVDEWKKPTTG